MNRIRESFRRNGHLFVLSICSALFVVTLQLIMNHLFPTTRDSGQIPSLDTAVGEIIPITQERSIQQLKSTLQEAELIEFQTNGQYEDKQAATQVRSIEVSLDRLFVPLDDATPDLAGKGTETSVHMRLTHNQDMYISICPQDNHYQKSCTIYLVSKAGKSIPVTVAISDFVLSGESIITLSQSTSAGEDSSIYTAKPIELDIRAI